ncbi:MAG: thiamine pyrophosphate-dependent dehydrogenase E1 component subunit alpha [Actinobacteria bacterium]|nr:thiamine pyrophosphate-dependent dehydrogenase E1 component subunit alpha [Actinomycetota bacterium]
MTKGNGRESDLLTLEDRRGLLRAMCLMRGVEERGLSLYKQGKIPGSFYDGHGMEAISVGATWALGAGDAVCSPLIRDLGAHLVRGTDLTDVFRHYMGRENALSHGREGNVHFGDRRLGVVGMVSMLPDMMVVATGIAMAFKMRSEERCALSFFGDGATSRGDWHEAMNWAALYRLPAVFVLENNQFAYSTPTSKQFAEDPIKRAAAYGMEGVSVDGNDVTAVFEATRAGREKALAGGGPTLIEARTLRMHGHGAHDDASYISAEMLEHWRRRDPIERLASRFADDEVAALEAEVKAAIDRAVEGALATPMPDPAGATASVYCSGVPEVLGEGAAPWSGFATPDALPAAA